MNAFLLSLYILIWPALTAVLLVVLSVAVAHDYREARKNGTDVV